MDATSTSAGRASLLARRSRARDQVAPDLRRPLPLLLPPDERTLGARLQRRLHRTQISQVKPGIEHEIRTLVGPDGTLPLHLYRTPQHGDGALLWIHSGHRIDGAAAHDHQICSEIAERTGALVVAVEHRTAPHPAPLDDAWRALGWMHENAGSLGIDPTRIAVGGTAGGGGLAAELAQRATDGLVPVCLQVLDQPMLDDRTVEHDDGRGALVWSAAANRIAWQQSLAIDGADAPWAVAARREDLCDLPPAWIGVGNLDLFLDEARDYADRLKTSQVKCTLVVMPGMYHLADRFAPEAPTSREYRDRMLQAITLAIGA